MALIGEISDKIWQRRYEFSKHTVDQSIIRKISVAKLEEAMTGDAEVIEQYLDD